MTRKKGGGRESGAAETRASPTQKGRTDPAQSALPAAANPAAFCANEGCGRPRLEAPGVKLCAVCRIAYLSGYRDHNIERMVPKVRTLEAELAALEKEAVEGAWRARAEKAEAELIKERNRSHWRPGPNHDCDVSGCSSVEHYPELRGEDSG